MSVVFDEVITHIESPGAAESGPLNAEPEQQPQQDNDEQCLHLLETRERRAKRLYAD